MQLAPDKDMLPLAGDFPAASHAGWLKLVLVPNASKQPLFIGSVLVAVRVAHGQTDIA